MLERNIGVLRLNKDRTCRKFFENLVQDKTCKHPLDRVFVYDAGLWLFSRIPGALVNPVDNE